MNAIKTNVLKETVAFVNNVLRILGILNQTDVVHAVKTVKIIIALLMDHVLIALIKSSD